MAAPAQPRPIGAEEFARPYRVDKGKRFRLKDFDPADTAFFKTDEHASDYLRLGIEHLSRLQEKLYAQDRWALLLIFQAMDAAGKDSAIKHVMSGVNPQGCQVYNFGPPSTEELDHDFMWRTSKSLPRRGHIGIFNRSYYEEVITTRVRPELVANEKLPPALVTKNIWKQRSKDIRAFEHYLSRNGIVVRKFYLHLSRGEQKARFLKRLEQPEKNWKFSIEDVHARRLWDDYMEAYQDAIRNTATDYAPWYIVPADNKWFTRLVVASAIIAALEELNLAFPKMDPARRRELNAARSALLREGRR